MEVDNLIFVFLKPVKLPICVFFDYPVYYIMNHEKGVEKLLDYCKDRLPRSNVCKNR